MTIVEGQIEPLKKLKEVLNKNCITRFNSIGEINYFIKNYDFEKNEVSKHVEHTLDLEINNLKDRFKQVEEKGKRNIITKFIFYLQLIILKSKISHLENNYKKIILKRITQEYE